MGTSSRLAAALSVLLLSAAQANACPVCFGKSDDSAGIAAGLTWGLYILLFCTFGILSGLTYAVVQLEKRKTVSDAVHE